MTVDIDEDELLRELLLLFADAVVDVGWGDDE
jgi:hypothetical protein